MAIKVKLSAPFTTRCATAIRFIPDIRANRHELIAIEKAMGIPRAKNKIIDAKRINITC